VTLFDVLSGQRRFVYLLVALVGVGGVWAATTLPSAIYPELNFARVAIVATGTSLGARQQLFSVSRPIEEAVSIVPGVTRVRSRTIRGGTEINVDFSPATEMVNALQEVRARVDQIVPDLPAGVSMQVERSRVGDLDEGLAGIHRGAQHGGHARDDSREGGAQRRELLGAPRGHGRHLRLGEIGGGLVGVLLRQNARLHQARRAGVIALRRVERGGGALRRGVERGPLELDQCVAQGDPLVGSHEDARDPRRARRGELGEVSRARGHGADGSHDPRERLLRRDRGRRRDGLGGGGLRIVGRGPRAAPGREDDEESEASHGWSWEAVSSWTAPAASFRSATSSM